MSQSSTLADGLTVATWARLPEEDLGELVDGSLVGEEMPDAAHETVVLFLGALFKAWLGGKGFVLPSGVKYALSARRGRKPDLSVFFPGGNVPPRRGAVRAPPDVAIEVISTSPDDRRSDRVEKLGEYARFGVSFYWLLDPEARTLEILELGAYRELHARDRRRRGIAGGARLLRSDARSRRALGGSRAPRRRHFGFVVRDAGRTVRRCGLRRRDILLQRELWDLRTRRWRAHSARLRRSPLACHRKGPSRPRSSGARRSRLVLPRHWPFAANRDELAVH